jgi:predicted naringenin-chalcone synthase
MSSATVLYVLERFIDRTDMAGTKGLMLSFGPVFRLKEYYYNFKANFNYL